MVNNFLFYIKDAKKCFVFIEDLFYNFAGNDEGVSCPKCNKNYKNLNSLRAHVYQICGKERKFECPMCSMKFKKRYNLKLHCTLKHT